MSAPAPPPSRRSASASIADANHAQRHLHANSDQLPRTQPRTCRLSAEIRFHLRPSSNPFLNSAFTSAHVFLTLSFDFSYSAYSGDLRTSSQAVFMSFFKSLHPSCRTICDYFCSGPVFFDWSASPTPLAVNLYCTKQPDEMKRIARRTKRIG